MRRIVGSFWVMIVAIFALCSCQHNPRWMGTPQSRKAVPNYLLAQMQQMDMDKNAPVLLRIFKKENQLEVWKQKRNGEFALLKSYSICAWSGKLGPKYMEYDRQAPEGFYEISPGNMNAYSHYYLALNIGFPNEFDKQNSRYGGSLMIHGGCSSSGCYSMTDDSIGEIYALVRDGFQGGQRYVQIQAFPFHLTALNMAVYRNDPNYAFWDQLRAGFAIFNFTRRPVQYSVIKGQYVFQGVWSTLYRQYEDIYNKKFAYYKRYSSGNESRLPNRLRGIKGRAEATLVSNWMRKVILGESVSVDPPHL